MNFDLPKLPEDWSYKPIESYCEQGSVTYGIVQPGAPVEKGVPLIRVNNFRDTHLDISDLMSVAPEIAAKYERTRLRGGEVLLTIVGSVGQVAVVPESLSGFNVARAVAVIRPRTTISSEWIAICLRSPLSQRLLSGRANTTVQTTINLKDLRALPIPFPPESERKAIITVIGSLDDRIALLRETNSTLESIAQAIFKSWFVDFDPVHAKMEGRAPEGMDKATVALFPDGFEESELGLVPKGWQARTMSDVSAVGIGKTPPRKEPEWFSSNLSDIRWLSIRDMGAAGVYASRTNEFLTRKGIEKFNVRVVPDNTVLMSFKMTIGRVAITNGEMTTNEAIAHFKLGHKAKLTTEYIYLHLKQFDFSTLSSTSSIADAVNSKAVREMPILVPSAQVLAVFQSYIGTVFEKLKNIEQQAQTLANLRDTLLPRLISGQLRLPEAEALVDEFS